jgi:hypothetical protein
LAALTGSSACASLALAPKTNVRPLQSPAPVTLVVGEITRPIDLVRSAGKPFFGEMQRLLPRVLESANISSRILPERDLGPQALPGTTFVLRYRIVEHDWVMTSTGGGCFAGLMVGGIVAIVPYFFVGLCTAEHELRMTVEARIFDAKGLTPQKVRDASSNEMLNIYDTSAATPVLRKEYPVRLTVQRPRDLVVTSQEFVAFFKEIATEAVRQIIGQSMNDVSRVLRPSPLAMK